MRIETLDTGAFTMNCCRFGRGDAPLVILPGISVQRVLDSANAIASGFRALAEDFTVYVFERRNDLPGGTTVRDMARDAARAMEALGLGPACVYGASQGGMIAMILAAEHPERVKKLALASTSDRISPERYRRVFQGWADLARAGDAEGLYLAFGEALYPERMYEKLKPLLLEIAKAVTDEDLRRFTVQTEALVGFDVRDDLGRIACPTLVMGSEDDAVFGGAAPRRVAAGIAGAELYMYDGYGHAVYDLAPDFQKRMRSFFAASASSR